MRANEENSTTQQVMNDVREANKKARKGGRIDVPRDSERKHCPDEDDEG